MEAIATKTDLETECHEKYTVARDNDPPMLECDFAAGFAAGARAVLTLLAQGDTLDDVVSEVEAFEKNL